MSLVGGSKTWLGPQPRPRVFISAVGVLAVSSIVVVALRGITQPTTALAFGGLVAVGELARIRLGSNREVAPIATAGGLAYAFLLSIGSLAVTYGAFQVIAVATAAISVGAAPHVAAARPVRLYDMSRRLLIIAIAALVFRPFADALAPVSTRSWATIGTLVGVLLLAGLLDILFAAAAQAGPVATRFRTVVRDEARRSTPLGSAVAATALLIVIAAHVMGWSALVVCMAPLVVTQVAYRRYSGIRATYLQTIRALSQAPEVGGYVEDGHSRRVSNLAIRLGQELGLSESELLDLEYAALMHDIGQLSLRDPKPSGATVHAPPEEQRRIAELGAEVVRQAGVLDRVAGLIEQQADPYERPPLASRIIKVANAYDDLTSAIPNSGRSRAALDYIRDGEGVAYDPVVVHALVRIVDHP